MLLDQSNLIMHTIGTIIHLFYPSESKLRHLYTELLVRGVAILGPRPTDRWHHRLRAGPRGSSETVGARCRRFHVARISWFTWIKCESNHTVHYKLNIHSSAKLTSKNRHQYNKTPIRWLWVEYGNSLIQPSTGTISLVLALWEYFLLLIEQKSKSTHNQWRRV